MTFMDIMYFHPSIHPSGILDNHLYNKFPGIFQVRGEI